MLPNLTKKDNAKFGRLRMMFVAQSMAGILNSMYWVRCFIVLLARTLPVTLKAVMKALIMPSLIMM